jgi:hypothetical protein
MAKKSSEKSNILATGADTSEVYRKTGTATGDFLKRKSKHRNSYSRRSEEVLLNLRN